MRQKVVGVVIVMAAVFLVMSVAKMFRGSGSEQTAKQLNVGRSSNIEKVRKEVAGKCFYGLMDTKNFNPNVDPMNRLQLEDYVRFGPDGTTCIASSGPGGGWTAAEYVEMDSNLFEIRCVVSGGLQDKFWWHAKDKRLSHMNTKTSYRPVPLSECKI